MGDLAVFNGDIARAIEIDCSGHRYDSLRIALAFGGQNVLAKLKRETFERDVMDELFIRCAAFEMDELRGPRRDRLDGLRCFARKRFIKQRSIAIEKPLAWGI